MSWFDAAGFANIAKSALKEAQKTIDRALDIKDESNIVPSNTPVDPGLEDFFGTWGLSHSGNVKQSKEDSSPFEGTTEDTVSSSLWGSFTGSFFDTNKAIETHEKLSSTSSLEDTVDANVEHFSQSKLVVQQSDDDLLSPSPENETDGDHSITNSSKILSGDLQCTEMNIGNYIYCLRRYLKQFAN